MTYEELKAKYGPESVEPLANGRGAPTYGAFLAWHKENAHSNPKTYTNWAKEKEEALLNCPQ